MQKILIQLDSANELLCYETVSLAMTLATFEHQVQMVCHPKTFSVLLNTGSRIYGMIQSFPLYELPKVWLYQGEKREQADWLLQMIDKSLASQFELVSTQIDLAEFDTVLSF